MAKEATAHKALTPGALEYEAPTTLDAALAVIAGLRSACEIGLHQIEQMQKTVDRLEEEAEDHAKELETARENAAAAEDHAADMEADATDARREAEEALEQAATTEESIIELGRILQKMKAGRNAEAISDMEIVMRDLDSDGRCRGAAVAVMLPVAGSF